MSGNYQLILYFKAIILLPQLPAKEVVYFTTFTFILSVLFPVQWISHRNNDNINYYYYIIILFYSFLVICNVFACGCQNEEGILADKIKKLN